MTAIPPAPPPAGLPPRAVLALVGGLVGLSATAWAAAEIVSALTPGWSVTGADADVADFVLTRRSAWLLATMGVVTLLGDLWFVAALVIVFGAVAVVRTREWRPLWLPALAGAGGFVISVIVKIATGRARPSFPFATVDALGPAFPSGHALRAMAVYAALALLAATFVSSRGARVGVWLVAGGVIMLVGSSRVYLGAHWLTDVIAGYALGAAWLVLVVRVTGSGGRPATQAPEPLWPEPLHDARS